MPICHLAQQHCVPLAALADAGSKLCLVILNQPLEDYRTLVQHLWSKACFSICADGGANRLYDLFKTAERTSFIPDLVSGDFDSIRTGVKEFYRNNGSKIIETPDQNETDFTKALRELYNHTRKCKEAEADQVMANINTLYKASEMNSKPCYLVEASSLSCLLQPGKHVLHVDTGYEGDWCGLVPIGCPSQVKTTGLKYNLDGEELRFGSLVSTSNSFENSATVTVETSNPILWSMEHRFQLVSDKNSRLR